MQVIFDPQDFEAGCRKQGMEQASEVIEWVPLPRKLSYQEISYSSLGHPGILAQFSETSLNCTNQSRRWNSTSH